MLYLITVHSKVYSFLLLTSSTDSTRSISMFYHIIPANIIFWAKPVREVSVGGVKAIVPEVTG